MYLHEIPDFDDLIGIIGRERNIDPYLVEKDYWIMHCLYGLQQSGFTFELKGGTSLSKGFGLIHRFSEDIDIQIEPTESLPRGKNQNKRVHVDARRVFFDGLVGHIDIVGVTQIQRDKEFDDAYMRSAGIRLHYESRNSIPTGVKDGVLLEAGFDQVTPNQPCDISSWAYDRAVETGVADLVDNRALQVSCYEPGYTLVEKLQTISTKYRQQQREGKSPRNFMRHYYDVHCLLKDEQVRAFIGTPEYFEHKDKRFRRGDEKDLCRNEAFLLTDQKTRDLYEDNYQETRSLYYLNMPSFAEILESIQVRAQQL